MYVSSTSVMVLTLKYMQPYSGFAMQTVASSRTLPVSRGAHQFFLFLFQT
jgi:hypothetical protein